MPSPGRLPAHGGPDGGLGGEDRPTITKMDVNVDTRYEIASRRHGTPGNTSIDGIYRKAAGSQ